MEVFKISKKSVCNSCFNINHECSLLSGKSCGTDTKVGYAFIESCSWLNKKITEIVHVRNIIKVDHCPESRVDMMGGGHNLELQAGRL